MPGLKHYEPKQRREVRRRNHIARDLMTPKYAPQIRKNKRSHLIDEAHERDAEEEYEFYKALGLGSK